MTDTHDLTLYILMRQDLASLNPGKACAQATHAANQCVFQADDHTCMQVELWAGDRGFGTCIVLGVDGHSLSQTITQAQRIGFHAGITHDPSYPVKDGAAIHAVPLDTCGYVFGSRRLLNPILDHLSLMQ